MAVTSISLVVFTLMLVAGLVAIFWGAFDDPLPQRASSMWAITCPLAGLTYGIGLDPLAAILATVSVLSLGSLAYWFMVTEPDTGEDDAEEPVEPEPSPSDDLVLELPKAVEPDPEPGIDWDEFDRVRADWERERTPAEPEPAREPLPSGV